MENEKLDYLISLVESNFITMGVILGNMNHLQARIEERSLEDVTKET